MNGSIAHRRLLPFLFGLARVKTGMTKESEVTGFVRNGAEPEEPLRLKPPRPANCKAFARARFAEAMPDIMAKLLEEVIKGSVPHLKVVLELTGLDKAEVTPPRARRKEKSLETILLEQWKRDGEEEMARRAAAEAAAEATANASAS